jgi:hypothetical protein
MNYKLVHPSRIIWRVSIPKSGDILSIYGDRTKKDLISSVKKLIDTDYRFEIEPVTRELLDKFTPIYNSHIASMKNGNIYDMYEIISDKTKANAVYESLSLYHGDEYLGGILFRKGGKKFFQKAKVFPKELNINIKLNITFIAEYTLYKYALSQNIYSISLGWDTNLFGKIGNIGLAIYKLRTGAQAFVPRLNGNIMSETFDFDNLIDENTLLFLGNPGSKIKEAKLFLNEKTKSLDKYLQLLNHDIIAVEVIK